MKTLNNPALNEANKIYYQADEISRVDGNRNLSLIDKAHTLVWEEYSDLGLDDFEDCFKNGHADLSRHLSGLMIAKGLFSKDLLPVMVNAVHADRDFAYKFINTLKKHLPREQLVDVIGVALESQHHNLRSNAFSVTKKSRFMELVPIVEKLTRSPAKSTRNEASVLYSFLTCKKMYKSI
jgi:hypothetical protein